MSVVIEQEPREQAGADSYNRFEYQAHWIVCHIVNQLDKNPKCIVFCEYHDDMAQLNDDNGPFEFYQIKTKEKNEEWTISELSARVKKANGSYKKSFLGFIFFNFLKFGKECSCCHFTSNANFDLDVQRWQSYIEDNKELKVENKELYEKIKKRIRDEYIDEMPIDFDGVFDTFIQNTYVYNSELQLYTYEDQVTGQFFNTLEEKKIPTDTAHIIFKQILTDVRKKSKHKITTPISFKSLVAKKGIRINKINKKLEQGIKKVGEYEEFYLYLNNLIFDERKVKRLIKVKQLHDARMLKVEDVRYIEIVLAIGKEIIAYNDSDKDDIYELKENCNKNLNRLNLDSIDLDEELVEVLFYEYKFRKNSEE